MRKYQQLFLVVISLISVTILLMYKSENNRLKDVLQVVNFFGRKDESDLIKIENTSNFLLSEHDYDTPLPTWQRLGTDFYGYSSYWYKNYMSKGGEVTTIVVGLEHSIVQFNCVLRFSNNQLIGGKFGFIRVDINSNSNMKTENFIVYKFLCKIATDFGPPEEIIFKNIQTNQQFSIPVRDTNVRKKTKNIITTCLDLNEYNITTRNEFTLKNNLIQYFLIHHVVGISEFIVYNNHGISNSFKKELIQNGIKINILPYNFPFSLENNQLKTRAIIEIDCMLRNLNSAKYFIVTTPNEYFLSNGYMKSTQSLMKFLNLQSENINKYEIEVINVCRNYNNSNTKILLENHLMDESKKYGSFSVYKPFYKNDVALNSVKVDKNLCLLFRYNTCKTDGRTKLNLIDYRNVITEEHMNYIKSIEMEIMKVLI